MQHLGEHPQAHGTMPQVFRPDAAAWHDADQPAPVLGKLLGEVAVVIGAMLALALVATVLVDLIPRT